MRIEDNVAVLCNRAIHSFTIPVEAMFRICTVQGLYLVHRPRMLPRFRQSLSCFSAAPVVLVSVLYSEILVAHFIPVLCCLRLERPLSRGHMKGIIRYH